MPSRRADPHEWQNWLDVISDFFRTGELCSIQKKANDNRYYGLVTILGRTFSGLLDSGATSSVISAHLCNKLFALGFTVQSVPTVTFTTADGTFHEVGNVVYLPIQFLNQYKVVQFYVMQNVNHNMLFGINFFEAFDLSIGNKEYNTKEIRSGNYEDIESLELNSFSSIIGRDELTEVQKRDLDKLIEDMRHKIGQGLGRTTLIEHRIDTEDHLPVSQRQYPFSPPIMRELEAEIDDMLKKDVIEPSYSSWRSPVLLVKKPSGQNRLCLDSRQLNRITKRDSYPLPRVTTVLDSLSNAQFLSTIDLKSAFWQIPLEESSKEKTAFGLAGKGLFQFKVMPFGLNNASQTQQRLMDRLFPPEHEGKIFSYLDDIVICSETFEEHSAALTWVMNQLNTAGLTINFDKCQFARPSLKYLGYIVDREGLRTDPEKVNAIISYPKPNTFTELKRFIGLASWYRRFVENFATVAAPLHDLTKGGKKGRLIKWTKEADEAFTNLKTALTTAPVLSCPDFCKEFVIQCDASNKGVGGVLVQTFDGIEKPVAFTSRKLTERETKFSTSERELLSVLHGIETFRPYVEGTRFKIITDHSALQWLHRAKDPHGRLARWAMRLQQFDFEVIFRKGTDHIVPDALSRAVSQEICVIEIK